MDNLIKKAIPFVIAFIVFIICLGILSTAGVGKFPAQGISLVIAYFVQNFFKKMISEEKESSKTSIGSINAENGPTCPECNGNNTYYDFRDNVFCRNCLKITSVKKSE